MTWTSGKKLIGGVWRDSFIIPWIKTDFKNKTQLFKTLEKGYK